MAAELPVEIVEKLLDRLATDDDFREYFRREPRAAFRFLGHETPIRELNRQGVDPVMCCDGSSLPSKDQVKESRDKLRAQLVGIPTYKLLSL